MLHCPTTRNGSNNQAFGDHIILQHYNNNLISCAEHPIRSLQTKWGFIKHDVYQFFGNYAVFLALNESGVKNEIFLGIGIENNIL